MNTPITLNKGQDEAVKAFLGFLLSDEKEMLITGSPGTGKSFLMKYMNTFAKENYANACKLIGKEPTLKNFYYTATTNKAAEVLGDFINEETYTIHKLLGLTVFENYQTGEVKLKKAKDTIVSDAVIFIDECSMINRELYDAIRKYTYNCKIVYVGDKYQLAPVKESLSPVFKNTKIVAELTEPVRNKSHKELLHVCEQLKETVKTGKFAPIIIDGSVIEYLDKNQIEERVKKDFKEFSLDRRILCYSNKNVIGYNNYIKESNSSYVFETGGVYICASAYEKNGKSIPVESPVTIKVLNEEDKVDITLSDNARTVVGTIRARQALVENQFGRLLNVIITPEYDKFMKILKSLANAKQWTDYFRYKSLILDIRPYEASTVHKAQGSTLDTVYIDLSDISRCTQPDMAARLLYVAFSRAKEKVVLFGRLKDAYGGITKH